MRMNFERFGGWSGSLAVAALVASGCGGLPAAEDGDGDGGGETPAVEMKSSAATAGCQASFNHGGNISQQTFAVTVGCFVSPGFHRTTATATNVGAGACSIAGWLYQSDPHSGQINVNVTNAGGFGNGTCNVTVFQDPDVRPPACAHSLCTVGVALRSDCSAGAAIVCSLDSFCCNSSWDSICVGEAASAHLACGS